MLPHNYWHSGAKGVIHTSKHSTCKRAGMGKPRKIYSSETIGGWYAEAITRKYVEPNECTELMPGDPSFVVFIYSSGGGC